MSNRPAGDRDGKDTDGTVAKTAGFVVFSGIAMSILKALNPCKTPNLNQNNDNNNVSESLTESTQSFQQSQSLAPQKPIIEKPITSGDDDVPNLKPRTVEIVRGDTLWGLSKRYGVSIQEIKEANGITGDTIYAGKKLVIP